MDFTVEQFEALNAAIAAGAVTVQYADRTVTYRSLNDMMRIRESMRKQLFPNSTNPANNRVAMSFSKGL